METIIDAEVIESDLENTVSENMVKSTQAKARTKPSKKYDKLIEWLGSTHIDDATIEELIKQNKLSIDKVIALFPDELKDISRSTVARACKNIKTPPV